MMNCLLFWWRSLTPYETIVYSIIAFAVIGIILNVLAILAFKAIGRYNEKHFDYWDRGR